MTTDINDNIAFARLMARNSALQQAQIHSIVSFQLDQFSIEMRIEALRSDTALNPSDIKSLIEPKFIDKTSTMMYTPCIEIRDQIYEIIADLCPNRDVEIIVSDGDTKVSVSYSKTRRI